MLALIIFQRMLSKTAWDSVCAEFALIESRVSFLDLKYGVCCHFLVLEWAPLFLRSALGLFS